jgi:hypothetical protein
MEEKVSLYNILDAKDFIARMDDEEEGLEEYSKSIAIQEKNKVNAIVGYLRENELTAEMIEVEIARLSEMAKFYRNRQERIKKSVTFAMKAHDIESIETGLFRLSFRKSESVEIEDALKIPEDYLVTKTTTSPDKVKIKKAIKDGEKIGGVIIRESSNLQIK